jgi:hypothetical protein
MMKAWDTMKIKAKLAVLIILVLAEIVYIADSFDGLMLFRDEIGSEIFNFCLALTLHGLSLLAITLGGIVRLKKRKEKFSLIKNILMLPIATVLTVAVAHFTIIDFDEHNLAGMVYLIFGLILVGLMHLHLPHKSKNKSKKADTSTPLLPAFTHIKAEWNYEEAAMEYCSLYNKDIEQLTEDEQDKILEYAGNWLAYFIAWLVKHGFYIFDNEIIQQDYEQSIIDENQTPQGLFESTDNCLSMHNIKSDLWKFMTHYFEYPHSLIGYYWDDYCEVTLDIGSINYCVEYSWDIYHKLEKLIDTAFREYTIKQEADVIEYNGDTFHCDWLDTDINVETLDTVSQEYIQQCISHLQLMPEKMQTEIRNAVVEWHDTDDIPMEEIIRSCNFDTITIPVPYGSEPAYTLDGEPDFEKEHGMSIIIRGNKVLEVGYRQDLHYCSPWQKEYVEKYMLSIE